MYRCRLSMRNYFKKRQDIGTKFNWWSKGAAMLLSIVPEILAVSCSTPAKTFAFSCQERQVEIYVDGQYLGRDLVYYTLPKGQRYIEVSGQEGGIEVYNRRIDTQNRKGNLIEIQIPKNYKYSSKPY